MNTEAPLVPWSLRGLPIYCGRKTYPTDCTCMERVPGRVLLNDKDKWFPVCMTCGSLRENTGTGHMTKGLAFWVLMLIWLVVWGITSFGGPYYSHYGMYGSGLLIFALFGLLGWQVFGAAVR